VTSPASGSFSGASPAEVGVQPMVRRLARGISPAVWSALLYVVLSLFFWGGSVVDNPQTTIIASNDIDPSNYMWFFGWWPHAVLHGQDPFFSRVVFAPDGYNLTWAAGMPGPSLLMAPLTLTLGPVITWNVISLLSPALSAWTAFLLCRHITGAVWPSLIGGYVFGFSPYMLEALRGAPQLLLVALLPVLVLLVLRHVEGSLSSRRFFIAMTAALAFQFSISTEVFAMATLLGVAALAAAFVLFTEHRTAVLATGKLVLAAYALTAVLVSPFLYYMAFRPYARPAQALVPYHLDLLAWFIPPRYVGPFQAPFGTEPWVNGAGYLGVPLAVIIGAFALQFRRSRAARLVLICLLVPAIATLGYRLTVGGYSTSVTLPWSPFAHLPLLRYAIVVRFAAFTFLAAAVVVAMWLAQRGGIARWALALLAVAFLVPSVGDKIWHTRVIDPPFFERGDYRAFLKTSDRVLTIPAWGPNTRWQAQAKFRFQLAAGYLGSFPSSYTRYPAFITMTTGQFTRDYAAQLRRFIADKGVTVIVVDKRDPGPWSKLFGTLEVRPVDTDGVLFYRLRRVHMEGKRGRSRRSHLSGRLRLPRCRRRTRATYDRVSLPATELEDRGGSSASFRWPPSQQCWPSAGAIGAARPRRQRKPRGIADQPPWDPSGDFTARGA
jgi:hypothetical protein